MGIRTSVIFGGLLLAAGLTGCATVDRGEPVDRLAPAGKPVYQPGSAYLFANRRLEQVVSTRNGRTLWQDQRSRRFTRDDNFVVPALSWQTGKGTYSQAVVKGDPDRLFPLGRGEVVWFDVVKTTPGGSQYRNVYRCKDEGGRRIRWQERPVDTYRVSCIRHYLQRGVTTVAAQQFDYYYAPEIGAVVRTDETNLRMRRTPRQKQLVTVLGPDQASPEAVAAERARIGSIARAASAE